MPAHRPGHSSLRVRLALSYAGIALLSVAVLGAVLIAVLSQHFRQSEDRYLAAVAQRASLDLGRSANTAEDLERSATFLALASQTRVRVFATDGEMVADSGLPGDIEPGAFVPPRRDSDRRERPNLPSPLGRGIFGSGDTHSPRSDRVLRAALTDSGGVEVGELLLSDGPASGRDVLASVAQVLGVAALFAMVLAGLVGYRLSSRIAQPIVELTGASDRMAEGDLAVRSAVVRDDEVGRLAASFNAMADRIEATVLTLRRFVADAAHEIGTPLTALQADLELADSAEEPQRREFVRRALDQARRIEDLSANLLRLSRIEAGEQPIDAVADLARVARNAVDAAASRAEQAGVEFVSRIEHASVSVAGDEGKLDVVVENLVDNALKFTPDGGRIELGLVTRESRAVLWVQDSGIGIPVAEQDAVFGRFYRARNVAAYPGSGLGLAIVLATVEGYGGSVGFHSDEGGTRFEVHLPLA